MPNIMLGVGCQVLYDTSLEFGLDNGKGTYYVIHPMDAMSIGLTTATTAIANH